MEGGRRRLTLYDQMLTVAGDSREIAGLTLNDVLTIHKRASPNPSPAVQLNSRTLLDVIREDEFHVGKERKYWKFLRNRLRLKRSGSIPISIRNTVRFDGFSPPPVNSGEPPPVHEIMHLEESQPSLRPQISRRNSTRFEPTRSDDFSFDNDGADTNTDTSPPRSLRPQMSRHNSTRFTVDRSESFADPTEPAREGTRRLSTALAEERALSAREAVAAQEAADAEAAAVAVAETPVTETAAQPVRMSLMDLLEETDRQMGFEGSRYTIADEEEEEAAVVEEEEEEEREENEDSSHGGGGEQNCCVCMVRHKGAAFIPCGHTFCRLCSRELLVSRGNCPLCNGFILEILDIF